MLKFFDHVVLVAGSVSDPASLVGGDTVADTAPTITDAAATASDPAAGPVSDLVSALGDATVADHGPTGVDVPSADVSANIEKAMCPKPAAASKDAVRTKVSLKLGKGRAAALVNKRLSSTVKEMSSTVPGDADCPKGSNAKPTGFEAPDATLLTATNGHVGGDSPVVPPSSSPVTRSMGKQLAASSAGSRLSDTVSTGSEDGAPSDGKSPADRYHNHLSP